jgi:hypothetical protein
MHRWSEDGERLVLVNLAPGPAEVWPEDVLAARPRPATWRVQWHSNAARYGGSGEAPEVRDGVVRVAGWMAVVLRPTPRPPP